MPTLTRRLSAIMLLVATPLAWSAWPADGAANQKRERVVVLKDDFDPPVKIKAIKAKGGPLKSDKKFLGDDDWFEGLTVSVTNDLDKAI